MNILLINHYAGSPELGMEYRPHYLGKAWVKAGHKVTILSASFAHVRTKQPKVSFDLQETKIDNITYAWLLVPPYQGNGVGRIKNIFAFTYKLRKYKKIIAQKYKPDAVIASSTYPLDNFVATKIAKLAGGKYFYEVHDLWPLSPMELGGYSKYHPFILLLQVAENYAYKHCDGVISMLPNTQEHMKAHGLDLKKWHYIPNGIDIKEWETTTDLEAKVATEIEKIRKKFQYIAAYTGAHGPANALESFVKTAFFDVHKNTAFVLVGKGPEKQNLQIFAQANNAKNVFFIDNINKKEMPILLSLFDFLYIGLKNEPLFRFGISPNKLIDYMMAKKPILQAINAGNNPVEEANCGLSVLPENPEELSVALQKLKNESEEVKLQMGENGRNFVLENHNYEKLSQKFIETIFLK